ncbi:829_t:CDS:2 [Cetraspora pellucida]|uniref:829_t:CDS:1 n=1 Tax=Cetraspora pellucida TaxID=1433469 RepID=A0A9N9GZ09_9GLOM|nr:829_t:CDS:2 [Cetraspora pellucida]
MEQNLLEECFEISQHDKDGINVEKRKAEASFQNVIVNKGRCLRSAIWDEFNIRESDRKRNYGAKLKDTDNSDNESMSPSSSKKPKVSQSNFKSIEPVSSKKSNAINKALLKAFICYGISFSVVDNLFFRDLFKLIKPGYILPGRTTLAG